MNETGKALMTALDKALEETAPDKTPLTTAFLQELRRTTGGTKRNWPDGLLVDGRVPVLKNPSHTVWQMATQAWSACGEPLASEEDIAKLLKLDEQMDAVLAQAKKYSLSGVSDHLHKIRDEIESDVMAGKALPEAITMHSHESVSRDFRAKQGAFMGLLVKITHEEVVSLARPILQRFDRTVEHLLKDTEESDRFLCETYGVEFHPSVIWKAFASVAMSHAGEARLPRSSAWATPSMILAGIV